ncbi:DUF6993 domain-containing protein [Specibacter sp. NPDC057265]|uniref:DUF6993 domain-containing protein n=1 Tax=Specibacter sp. NPDC057265 TaxID=3346075 RepID=UPI003636D760
MTLDEMTPRRKPHSRRTGLRGVAASLVVAAALGLGGCSLLPNDGSAGEQAPAATSAAAEAPAAPDAAAPDAAAAEGAAPQEPAQPLTAAGELGKKLEGTLGTLAQTTKTPNRAQMLNAMLTAGAVKEKTEVSIDITPTGLAVDAIEAATLVAEECVVGQVREGNVAVTVLPALASGRCFVGEVLPLP